MQPTPPITASFIRPAAIGLRFNDEAAYRQALVTYAKVLHTSCNASNTINSLAMGVGTSGKEGAEVRISFDTLLHAPEKIVYWEVNPLQYRDVSEYLRTECQLKVVGTELLTDPDPLPPGHTVAPQRSVFTDGSGNDVGIVINPAIPFMKVGDAIAAPNAPVSSLLASPLDLGIGVVVGIILSVIVRRVFS